MKIVRPSTLIAVLLIGLLPTASPILAQSSLGLTAEQRQWIEEHPVVTVGGQVDWGPFDFINAQGRYVGIGNDYLDLIARSTGLRFEVKTDSWSNLLQKFERGEIDLLPAIYFTEERDKTYNYTSKYHQVTEYVFARDDAGISSPAGLTGKTAAMIAGFASIDTLRQAHPELKILEFPSLDGAINAVVTYKADILFDSLATVSFTLRQKSITNIRPAFSLEFSKPYGLFMASRQEMPELAGIVSTVLQDIDESEKQAILVKWLGGARPTTEEAAEAVVLTPEEQAWVEDHAVIRVHNEMDWPPFNFNENGEPRGYSIDHMNLVAARVGLEVEYISGPSWQQFLDMFRAGELDVIANATPTIERRDYMHFTSTFLDHPAAVVVEESKTGIDSFEDLRGRRVAVVEGFYQQEYLESKYPEAELVLEKNILDCLYTVMEGRADALVASFPATKYLMDKNALIGLRFAVISRDPEMISSNALAVRHDWPLLRDILQKGMDALDEKDVTDLRQKWFGTEISSASTERKVELTAEQRTWISDHPVIRVHNEMDSPPFNFNENGEPRGLSIDVMNLVASRAGLQVEYISGPSWQEFLDMIQSDELDVMLNINATPERSEYLNFTDHYLQSPAVVVVKDTTLRVQSLQDLHGKRVAVPGGFFTEEFLAREHPEIELVLERDSLGSLYAVLEGRADAMLDDFSLTDYLINQHTLSGLQVALITRHPGLVSVHNLGVRKDWRILRDILQKSMDAVDEKDMTALRQKWLGAGLSSAPAERKVELTAEERAWISEHAVIRAHNEMDWPPFNFNENGEPRGYAIEFMNLVAPKVGLRVEYISGRTWQQFLDMLRAGELDVILNATPTDLRREYMQFTSTYIDQPVAVVIEESTTGINSFEDLRDRRVAVVEGFYHQEYMERKYPETELILEDNTLDTLYTVMEGRADAMVASYPATKYLMDKNSLLGLKVAIMSRDAEWMTSNAMAVRHDWPVLRDILQKGMDSLDEAEVDELRQKWLGADKDVVPTVGALNTVWWLVGGVLALFLLLMLLNVVSRRFSPDAGAVLQTGTLRFRILIFGSLSIFVVMVAIVGWFALQRINEKILRDVNNNLESVLLTTAERLELWVDQQIAVLTQVVRNPIIVNDVEGLLSGDGDTQTLLRSNELAAIRIALSQLQEEFGLGFFVVNRQGISIGSDRDSGVGTRNPIATQRPELLGRVFAGKSVFVPPVISEVAGDDGNVEHTTSLFIAVPVLRSTGEVIAALAMGLDPAVGFSRILQFSRVGESGETYAFDQTGTLMSASRFEGDLRAIDLLDEVESSILNIQIRDPGGNMTDGFRSEVPRAEHPLTLMAESAITASADARDKRSPVQRNMDGYRDYRGVSVYGAWLWDGQLGLGLTSEIDVVEAMSTYTIVRLTSFGVLGVTLFLSLGGIVFVLVTGERTNKALLRAKDELEDRVEERTEELEKATKQTHQILENSTDGILTIDDRQVVVGFNPACEDMWGYKAEEVLGNEITMLIPEYARKDHLKKVHGFRDAEAKGVQMENRGLNLFGLTKAGDVFSAEVGISKNEVDGETFYSAFIKDITERQKAEAEILTAKEQFSTLVENIPGAVYRFRFDENFTTIFYSEHFIVLTGYPAKDFMSGKLNFGDLIHPDDRDSVDQDLNDAVAAKRPFEHEFRIVDRAGGTRWISSHGKAVYDSEGKAEFGDGTMFDITEQKRLQHKLADAYARMSEELNVGADIQMSMLPLEFPAFPDRQEFDIYALLQPAREVGGDFYDFFFINDRELCLIVGDVSGKGVPAALFMAVTKTMLRARAIDDPSPASVMTRVNNELSADNPASMFVTLFMAIVDVHNGEIRFTNAGHNPPYILRKSAAIDCLDQRHGPIIGAVEGVAYKESQSELGDGDSVFIFTDGVTEAMDVSGQLYSDDRLEKFLGQANISSSEQLTKDTLAAVEDFAIGAEQADDITILTFTLQQSAKIPDQPQLEITIKADMSEIERVNVAFSEYAEKVGLSAAVIQKVSISFDELLNNIVAYGFDDPEGHEIEIDAERRNGRLVITVTDDGKPFNPFDRVGPDTTLSVEERDIGGLGVLIVGELMDECSYRRLRNRNVVTLTMTTES